MVKFIKFASNILKITLFLIFLFVALYLLNPANRPIPIELNNSKYEIVSYRDSCENSAISNFSIKDSIVKLEYSLDYNCQDPYVGFEIYSKDYSDMYTDISNYDFIQFKIDDKSDNFILYLMFFKDGFSNHDDESTYITLEKRVNLKKGEKNYQIALNDFLLPNWWLSKNHTSLDKIGEIDFSKLICIAFESPRDILENHSLRIAVKDIYFKKENRTILLFLLLSILIAIFLSLIRYYINLKKEYENNYEINYTKQNLSNYSDEEIKKVTEYLGKNFSNRALSLNLIHRDTGVMPRKISQLTQKYYNLSYNEYLNKIRINEAKRFLRETDRQITDIAHTVGYTSIYSFTRAFKKITDTSPSEYRKNH